MPTRPRLAGFVRTSVNQGSKLVDSSMIGTTRGRVRTLDITEAGPDEFTTSAAISPMTMATTTTTTTQAAIRPLGSVRHL